MNRRSSLLLQIAATSMIGLSACETFRYSDSEIFGPPAPAAPPEPAAAEEDPADQPPLEDDPLLVDDLAGFDEPLPAESPELPAVADDSVASAPPPMPERPAEQSFESIEGVSNDGTYVVRYRTIPSPLPLNELFSIQVEVRMADKEALPPGISLAVDGAMPAHHHGMNTQPVVVPTAAGYFLAEGMLFHMPGHWELYFDVTNQGITERAQFDVDLE